MIHPLQGLAMRGAIWYQGESNIDDGLAYEKKMQALVSGWRQVGHWRLSILFVQLAPLGVTPVPNWGRYGKLSCRLVVLSPMLAWPLPPILAT